MIMECSGLMDYFDVKEKEENYAPWDNRVKQELVLRYWFCSLRCYLCYSQRIAYLERPSEKECFSFQDCVNALKNFSGSIRWVRIQGGEPFLGDTRPLFTARISVEALKQLLKSGRFRDPNPRIIIQTNGIWFGQVDLGKIKEIVEKIHQSLSEIEEGRVIFEISFKGPNHRIANEYAKSEGIPVEDVLQLQLKGFFQILEAIENVAWSNGDTRMAVYPVGGLGPRLDDPSFIPVDRSRGNLLPIFHPVTWSEEFKEMVYSFFGILDKWKVVYEEFLKQHGKKIPLEVMEESKFQWGWLSQIKHRENLRKFVKRNLFVRWTPKLNYFKKILEEFDLPKAPDELVKEVNNLKGYFYEAEPSTHYPFL